MSNRSVAFQGELGAFSHSAALKILTKRVRVVPCVSFRNVFQALKSDRVSHAVIPIENSLHGSVLENYDNLLEYGFVISGETTVQISHQLIAQPGMTFQKIRRARSHPVALSQCREFFLKYPQIKPEPFYDTAGSVKQLREEPPSDAAAIASAQAAALYGGVILRRNIQDRCENVTRFFLLAKQNQVRSTGKNWKTSIVFSTENSPGALFRAIACFALRNISLTKIESRPLRGKPWEYLFYVDFIGSVMEKNVKNALANLKETSHFFKLLGTYQPTL